MIYIINPQHKPPPNVEVINTTSRSTNWSRGLSPFILGPCDLYNGYKSLNFENCWQYSKIYEYYLQEDGTVGDRYFTWAKSGWSKSRADRYPMGKGVKPLYSYWDGKTLPYIEARKEIYIPLYSKAVKDTNAFKELTRLHQLGDIALVDFDAHGLQPGTFNYWDLWNNPNIKVGHAYVLAMMLESII